jgi:prepilin-type processing-associated H-X9-DG protein
LRENFTPQAACVAKSLIKPLGIADAVDSIGLMKTQTAKGHTAALTRIELVVIIAVVGVLLVAVLLPALAAAKRATQHSNCVNRLHEIVTSFRVWEGDNNNKYPMQFYATNLLGASLMKSGGGAHFLWRTMSNELSTPQVLVCPEDREHTMATNFDIDFSDANISYFFNLDAVDETHPNMILAGDDNLAMNGIRVKPGILNFPTTNSLAWTNDRHGGGGNVSMADGSVQQLTVQGLNTAVIAATNGAAVSYRLVIP